MQKLYNVYAINYQQCTMYGDKNTWKSLFVEYKDILTDTPLIQQQYEAYENGTAPKVDSLVIKQIPIAENGDPIIDLKDTPHKRISMMPDPQYPLQGKNYNSGFPGNSKMRKPVLDALKKMLENLDKYAHHFGYWSGQITIKIFDALRNREVEKFIYDSKWRQNKQKNPQVHQEAFDRVPVHTGGGAIDLRLWDNTTKNYLDLGEETFFYHKKIGEMYCKYYLADKQRKNRLFCLLAATRAELVPSVYKLWRYSLGDSTAVYWLENDSAKRVCHYDVVPQDPLEISYDKNNHLLIKVIKPEKQENNNEIR